MKNIESRSATIRIATTLAACVLVCGAAHSYSSIADVTIARNMSGTSINAAGTITVTLTFTVGAIGSDPIRGFFISEHVPVELAASAGTVTVNSTPVTVVREQTAAPTPLVGTNTERWVFETPPAWAEALPVNAGDVIELTYDLTLAPAAITGTAEFPGCNWAGSIAAVAGTTDEFGYEDAPTTVAVVDDIPPALVGAAADSLDTIVEVEFSEDISVATAGDAANYAIDNGIAVLSVTIEDSRRVSLVTDPMTTGPTYTLTVTNITDVSGNTMPAPEQDTFQFVLSLVVHWKFDDDTGGVTSDSSPNAYDGTITGAVLNTGLVGNCLDFDGTDDRVTRTITSWDAAEYTICMWARAGATGQANYTSVFNNSATGGDTTLQIDVDGTTPGNYRIHTGVDITIGPVQLVWQHVAVTYDGTFMRTYLDGVLTNTSAVTHAKAGTVFTRFDAGRNRAANQYFQGSIDDLRVYDVAIPASAVTALHDAGS